MAEKCKIWNEKWLIKIHVFVENNAIYEMKSESSDYQNHDLKSLKQNLKEEKFIAIIMLSGWWQL